MSPNINRSIKLITNTLYLYKKNESISTYAYNKLSIRIYKQLKKYLQECWINNLAKFYTTGFILIIAAIINLKQKMGEKHLSELNTQIKWTLPDEKMDKTIQFAINRFKSCSKPILFVIKDKSIKKN